MVAVFPFPEIDWIWSQPVRLTGLFFGSTNACQRARRSFAVTGTPSLQTALFLYVRRIVSGLRLMIFGFDAQSRGISFPTLLRIWHPYQMLLTTMLVAYRLFPVHSSWRFGGSWSWMKTMVPAVWRSGFAAAPEPPTRPATIAAAI